MLRFLLFMLSASFLSCGQPNKVVGPPVIACQAGSSRNLVCPDGSPGFITEVCSQGAWLQSKNTCTGSGNNSCANKVTFDKDIKTILTNKCVSCHSSPEKYDDFEVAKEHMLAPNDVFLDRVLRDDQRRMPKPPLAPLSAQEIDLLRKWQEDGLIRNAQECNNRSGGSLINLDAIEKAIFEDASRLGARARTARYISFAHKVNEGKSPQDMLVYKDALVKALNSISLNERVAQVTAIDSQNSIFRFNLEDFQLDANPKWGGFRNGWDLVLNKEVFKVPSQTTTGKLIRDLTGTAFPWLYGDSFILTINENSEVYYKALGIPGTLRELLAKLNINLQARYDRSIIARRNDRNSASEVLLGGGFGSPISRNKNRLVLRTETERSLLSRENGFFYFTFDPIDVENVPERNLFFAPCPAEARCERTFDFAAGEMFWTLPNGLMAFALVNNQGIIQAEAPIEVVTDTDSPISPIIVNAISCYRCHASGPLNMEDQIRPFIFENADQFNNDDFEKITLFYPDQTVWNAAFSVDRRLYNDALRASNVSNSGPDPINATTDLFRKDWTLAQFCSFTLNDINTCRIKLDQSRNSLKAQIGQLLTPNGTVSLNQIKQSFPLIIQEFELGQD